jgi:hypothetical protein
MSRIFWTSCPRFIVDDLVIFLACGRCRPRPSARNSQANAASLRTAYRKSAIFENQSGNWIGSAGRRIVSILATAKTAGGPDHRYAAQKMAGLPKR